MKYAKIWTVTRISLHYFPMFVVPRSDCIATIEDVKLKELTLISTKSSFSIMV